MTDMILSLLAGMALGLIFRVLNLPIPAPATLSGVAGIFGVWLGFMAMVWLRR